MLHGSCLPCALDMVHALAVFRQSFWTPHHHWSEGVINQVANTRYDWYVRIYHTRINDFLYFFHNIHPVGDLTKDNVTIVKLKRTSARSYRSRASSYPARNHSCYKELIGIQSNTRRSKQSGLGSVGESAGIEPSYIHRARLLPMTRSNELFLCKFQFSPGQHLQVKIKSSATLGKWRYRPLLDYVHSGTCLVLIFKAFVPMIVGTYLVKLGI